MFYNGIVDTRDTQIHCSTEQKAIAEAEESPVLPGRPPTYWYRKGHRKVWDFCTGNRNRGQESVGAMGKTEIQCFFLL